MKRRAARAFCEGVDGQARLFWLAMQSAPAGRGDCRAVPFVGPLPSDKAARRPVPRMGLARGKPLRKQCCALCGASPIASLSNRNEPYGVLGVQMRPQPRLQGGQTVTQEIILEVTQAAAFADHVQQVAVQAGLRIGPLACCSAAVHRFGLANIHGPAGGILNITGNPVVRLPLVVRKVVAAHSLVVSRFDAAPLVAFLQQRRRTMGLKRTDEIRKDAVWIALIRGLTTAPAIDTQY